MNKNLHEIPRKNLGIYIHIPFCASKCPYCDFYSAVPKVVGKDMIKEYTEGLIKRVKEFSLLYKEKYIVDTIYFGGGTPSVLGENNLCAILSAVKEHFNVTEDAEITVEVNPERARLEFFEVLHKGGFNRISMGLQSANPDELKLLGRRHSLKDVENAVKYAKDSGIDNISLDLMIGLPGGTKDKLLNSIMFCDGLGVNHISSYILKIEEGTFFYRKGIEPMDDDEVSEQYLFVSEKLDELGYKHYEISNYTKDGYKSKHNLKYWNCEEYLGIGPSAHSFIDGKRFYFPRDTEGFINGNEYIYDGEGGDIEEKIMLKLRLSEGLSKSDLFSYEGHEEIWKNLYKRAEKLPKNLININEDNIALTEEGFLISNSVIVYLLD